MKLRIISRVKKLKDKRVIVRVDLNVPITDKKVVDNTRIRAVIPTIKFLKKNGAKVILITHLGRPRRFIANKNSKCVNNGKFKIYRDSVYSNKIVLKELNRLIGGGIKFSRCCVGDGVKKKVKKMSAGDVLLLENIRFYNEEIGNNIGFTKSISELGDIYVNDAFSVSHRNHASVMVGKYIPCYAGLLFNKELGNLNKLIEKPKKPYIILLGGAKLSTKIGVIDNLKKQSSKILIGGAMANVFLKAQGYTVGKSLIEKGTVREAKKMLKNKKIILPTDVVVDNGGDTIVRGIKDVKTGDVILDIGPKSVARYSRFLNKAKTILWNGPMGKFEFGQFSNGSLSLARVIAAIPRSKAYSVCGGGETIEVLNMVKKYKDVGWVSTGGGAMLSYVSGEDMPGLDLLKSNSK